MGQKFALQRKGRGTPIINPVLNGGLWSLKSALLLLPRPAPNEISFNGKTSHQLIEVTTENT